jgi:hypothetical protein
MAMRRKTTSRYANRDIRLWLLSSDDSCRTRLGGPSVVQSSFALASLIPVAVALVHAPEHTEYSLICVKWITQRPFI